VSDLRKTPDPGWREIATAPHDGTFIRLERFGLIGGYVEPEVGHWREEQNGFKGWWDRAGMYLSPPPTHWLPEQGSVN
jgi:hypothetical protein